MIMIGILTKDGTMWEADDMGDKWLNTYLFKERNGMNTDKELAEAIETVFEKTGIRLEPEVRIW